MTEPTTMICPDCGEKFPTSEMTFVEGGAHICPDCLEDNYEQCGQCGQWSQRGYTSPADEFLCDACAAEIEAEPTLDENERMSQLNEKEFMEGFNIAAPGYYDYTADCETSTPWCAPWYSQSVEAWYRPGMSAYDMGKAWAREVRRDMDDLRRQGQFPGWMYVIHDGETWDADDAINYIERNGLWEQVVEMMDDQTREIVNSELAPCTHLQFLERYLELAPFDLNID